METTAGSILGSEENDVLQFDATSILSVNYDGLAGNDLIEVQLTEEQLRSQEVARSLSKALSTVENNANAAKQKVISLKISNASINAKNIEELRILLDGQEFDLGQVSLLTGGMLGRSIKETAKTAKGVFGFFDLDRGSHTVQILNPQGAYGTLTAKVTDQATNDGVGKIQWTYSIQKEKVKALNSGDNPVEQFTVRIIDEAGHYVDQLISVSIQGITNGAKGSIKSGAHGKIVDGYVSGATVFIDYDADGIIDGDEPTTTSDEDGDYTLLATKVGGVITAIGGVDISTGDVNTFIYKMAANLGTNTSTSATQLTPLTTLIYSISSQSSTVNEVSIAAAEQLLKNAFNLTSSKSLLTLDPIEGFNSNDPAVTEFSLDALQLGAQVVSLTKIAAVIVGNQTSSTSAVQAVVNQLASLIAQGGVVDLTSNETLSGLIVSALGGEAADGFAELIRELTMINNNISQAQSLVEIAQWQKELSGYLAAFFNLGPEVLMNLNSSVTDEDGFFSFSFDQNAFISPEGKSLTYTATLADGGSLPAWLQFDSSTRTFSGTPLQADVGSIEIRVLASDGIESASNTFTLTVANVNDTGIARIIGVPEQGQTLSVELSDEDGLDNAVLTYQWYADGKKIGGANDETYTLKKNDIRKSVSVEVTYTDDFGAQEVIMSAPAAPVANVNDPGVVTIEGTPEQGQILSIIISDDDGFGSKNNKVAYEWFADGELIAGETKKTLTLTQSQVGLAINAIATYTDDEGTDEIVSSLPTIDVVNVNDLPVGELQISGASGGGAKQNDVLTVGLKNGNLSDLDGLPSPDSYSYQWRAGNSNIDGANGTSYTLTQADVGKVITVVMTYKDGQGTNETLSASTDVVKNVNDAPNGEVKVVGEAKQNETLTAELNFTDMDGLPLLQSGYSYEWMANGRAISGQTGSTLVLTQDLVGKFISVKVSYTDNWLTSESLTSASSAAVTNVNDAPSGTVNISGNIVQGQKLTATPSLTDLDGLDARGFSYQWKADGSDIIGATSTTFTLTQAEVGKKITVTVSYTDDLNTPESVTSSETIEVANLNDLPVGAVTISGTAAQGQLLTASHNLTDADGTSGANFSYQWRANGVDITNATEATYTLTQAEVGKTITVAVSYTDDLRTLETVTSSATRAVENVNDAGVAVITGTAKQGETLAVTVTDNDGTTGASYTYQWKANNVNIAGATASTYTLTQAEVGKTITVTVVYTDDFRTRETINSAATGSVENINDVGSVVITGTATQGQILGSTVTDIDGLSNLISYQWKSDGQDIAGATASTLTLTQDQVGKLITLMVSYTDDGGTFETRTSSATTAVVDVNDNPTITAGPSFDSSSVTITANDVDGTNTLALFAGNTKLGDISKGSSSSVSISAAGSLVQGESLLVKDSASTPGSSDTGWVIYIGTANADTGNSLKAGSTKAVMYGFGGNDVILGSSAGDYIFGGDGADAITGNAGADILQGGAGNDTFIYLASSNSTTAARDVIVDFTSGDKINLKSIDAATVGAGGDQDFSSTLLASSGDFTLTAQIRVWNDGINTFVEGNTDNDLTNAEFSIQLSGVITLVSTDFVL